ncbi:hypothetical protein L2E82_22770 [Cichorium intybus]|uniref:Uncharacterized protein n=1 Tax=Cichorium intybus TaxID=13427 RepID=A0ACB9DYB2_CICIN|nr:hypothetical protein L2E82_22770 [Cichorium intybus]
MARAQLENPQIRVNDDIRACICLYLYLLTEHMLPGISNGGTRLSYFDLFHRKKSPQIIRKVKALASLFPI